MEAKHFEKTSAWSVFLEGKPIAAEDDVLFKVTMMKGTTGSNMFSSKLTMLK